MVRDIGGEATFVANSNAHTFVMDDFLQRMKHFSAIADGFSETGRADGDDHELLQVQVVVGMCATVDHVHHRHWQLCRMHTAKVAIQRQARFFGSRTGYSHGHCEYGVGT